MSLSHDVVGSLRTVLSQLQKSVIANNVTQKVNLLAVCKTKPASYVKAAYDEGQRHFGENYVNELLGKAPDCPSDIKWHFIGRLQSNKVKHIIKIPNLYIVESVDSLKLALKLNKACENVQRADKLKILVQVNTSGEESKSGCTPDECISLVTDVIEQCNNLHFAGLMTIGEYEVDPTPVFFERLNACKEQVLEKYPNLRDDFVMSMGMSHDFDLAIANGSTEIRVGTAIFGPRGYIVSDDEE